MAPLRDAATELLDIGSRPNAAGVLFDLAEAAADAEDTTVAAEAAEGLGAVAELMGPLRAWVEDGSLRPVVAQEFRLDDGAAAHRYMHERSNVGKVVLTL